MKARLLFARLTLAGTLFGLILAGPVRLSTGQKLNPSRPGVYLTFKEFVKSNSAQSLSEAARLVLHNNTKWPLYYGKDFDPRFPRGHSIVYIIEMETGCRDDRDHVDIVSSGKLLPGKTTSFLVPREDMPSKSEVYVEFYFVWELNHGQRVPREVVHRAYFGSRSLPAWPRN